LKNFEFYQKKNLIVKKIIFMTFSLFFSIFLVLSFIIATDIMLLFWLHIFENLNFPPKLTRVKFKKCIFSCPFNVDVALKKII